MSPERFHHLFGLVENIITKEEKNFCKAISAGERLAVTLLPCIRRTATLVITCVSHREINPELLYQGNL